jgi:hypothetical protein
MLKPEDLKDEQWQAVRDAPHYVILAVSAAGGSVFDEMLERAAGLEGVVSGLESTHPLLQKIAASDQIMKAQQDTRDWIHTLNREHRNATSLQVKALDTLRAACAAIQQAGGADDLTRYGEFVHGIALRVARSAREGDVLGLGGEIVSKSESDFIARVAEIVGIESA